MHKSKTNEGIPESTCLWATAVTAAGYLAVLALYVAGAVYSGTSVAIPIDVCVGTKVDNNPPPVTNARIIILSPIAIVPFTTFCTDLSLLHFMKKIQPFQGKFKKDYTIPVNATLLSTVFFFIAVALLSMGHSLGLSKPQKNLAITSVDLLVLALRCPLITFLTFKAKERSDMESREHRQERERNFAVAARLKRERIHGEEAAIALNVARNLAKTQKHRHNIERRT